MTIGQDEACCVVCGMPKEAFKLGMVGREMQLNDIAVAMPGVIR